MKNLIPIEKIEKRIILLRGYKVMLDSDLADLYGVDTKALIQAVKRNIGRFPTDFMFQLNYQEVARLRSQIVTLDVKGRGKYRKYMPYVFTEQGIAMLSSVLKSKRAVRVNIEIMRAFVQIREILATHKDLARKLAELEKRYDSQFKIVFDAIRQMIVSPESKEKRIGFITAK